jgi:hypothetical protein
MGIDIDTATVYVFALATKLQKFSKQPRRLLKRATPARAERCGNKDSDVMV